MKFFRLSAPVRRTAWVFPVLLFGVVCLWCMKSPVWADDVSNVELPTPDFLVDPVPQSKGTAPLPNRIIVKLNPHGSDESIVQLRTEIEATLVHQYELIDAQVWAVTGGDADTVIAQYQYDPRIAHMEKDSIIWLDRQAYDESSDLTVGHASSTASNSANDAWFSQQWGLHNTGQNGGAVDADIDALEAWAIITDTDIVIGVIDSGIQYTHTDLVANMWVNPGETAANGVDDDGNGYIDDVHGWDFFENDNNPSDTNGHGTHVAGTIAASSNNEIGVSGVTWRAELMALRFIGPDGWGYLSDAIAAIEYATLMDADLTNNSWGGGGYYQTMYDAIAAAEQAGRLFVAAAGNDANNNDASPAYPASYDLDNIISVASTTRTDTLSSFSNYGRTSVDLGAPGSSILSTYPGGYAYMSGTSMATPHVSGAVALLLAAHPSETAFEIKQRILETTDPVPALTNVSLSGGRLNLNSALLYSSPAPAFEYSVPSLQFELETGQHITQTLIFTNGGDADLVWTLDVSYGENAEQGWIQTAVVSNTVGPGTSSPLALHVDGAGMAAGIYTATLTFGTNDPDNTQIGFEVSLKLTAATDALLSLPVDLEAAYWPEGSHPDPLINDVEIPIVLQSHSLQLGAAIFSLDLHQECLNFNSADSDEDGVPDSISFGVTSDFSTSVQYDASDVDGELDFVIADLSDPIASLNDGVLVTVRLTLACEPQGDNKVEVPLHFANDPALSISDTSGRSVPAQGDSGSVQISLGHWLGDCNGDQTVDAADASATILEIFDGDGSSWDEVESGTFEGSALGCDSNKDEQVDAGDLICTVLQIFEGQKVCSGHGAPHGFSPGRGEATLYLESVTYDQKTERLSVPVRLDAGAHNVGAVTFGLWYDTALLRFNDADADFNGTADGVESHLLDHTISAVHDFAGSRLNFAVADLSPETTLAPLPSGRIMTLQFEVERGAQSANELTSQLIQTTKLIDFSTGFRSSGGNLRGHSVPVQSVNEAAIRRIEVEQQARTHLFVPLLVQ